MSTLHYSWIRRRNDELSTRLCLQDGQRHRIQLADGNARRIERLTTSIIVVHDIYESGLIGTVGIGQPWERWHAVECAAESIADALSLIRAEEERFVLLDGS